MKIYTSYFGNINNLIKNNIIPIGVCCYPPNDFKGVNLTSIAPTPDILNNCRSNHQEFRKRYKAEVLSIFKDPNLFIDRLRFITDNKDCALCCFEKPDEFCHRHLIADWLNETLNLDVHEYSKTNEIKINPLF